MRRGGGGECGKEKKRRSKSSSYQVLDLAPNLLMRSNCIAQITQSAGISLRGTSGVEKGLD